MSLNQAKWLSSPVKGLLLDITGVLKEGENAIKGSVEAIQKLNNAGLPFCLVSNESMRTREDLCEKLHSMGFDIVMSRVITPIPVMVSILKKKNLRPYLLVRDEVMPEFEGIDMSEPNCVVMGDAFKKFTYPHLNGFFQTLKSMDNPLFFSLGIGKYYKDDEGIVLDVGAFTKGIEYATGVKAETVGKPSPDYFQTAIDCLGFKPHEVVMIGDDIEFDVGGAQGCGIRGVLVRTGKYIPANENHPKVKPDFIADDLSQAVQLVLQSYKSSTL